MIYFDILSGKRLTVLIPINLILRGKQKTFLVEQFTGD